MNAFSAKWIKFIKCKINLENQFPDSENQFETQIHFENCFIQNEENFRNLIESFGINFTINPSSNSESQNNLMWSNEDLLEFDEIQNGEDQKEIDEKNENL